jgi:small-conductance mechanosensitive channel
VPDRTDYFYRLFRKLGLSDFGADTARVLVQRPMEIILILAAALVLSRLGARVARRSVQGLVIRSARDQASTRAQVRAQTLGGVCASTVRIFVWSVAALLVLDKLGLNLGPLLAGASIVGVAVGFGAQSLVKDFLSGFFVLAEDQFGVGDAVTLEGVSGTVEEVNLRITRVRTFDGTVWFVPNGEIRTVGNSAKEWARAVVDVALPASTDLATAMSAIADEVSGLSGRPELSESLLEDPQVLGVEATAADSFTIRVAAKTQPAARTSVAREIRARVGARLRSEGVIPLREQTAAGPAASGPESQAATDSGGV